MRSRSLCGCRYGFVLLSLLALLGGCGPSGPKRCAVTGTVTFDGQPVERGVVTFFDRDGKGPTEGAEIADGKFACQLTPGEKRVEIMATRESPTPAKDGMPDYVSYIPEQYNTKSTLTASVKPSGENKLTFDLQAAKPGR